MRTYDSIARELKRLAEAERPRCGCAVNAPEADPALYRCPCGAHCPTCEPLPSSHDITREAASLAGRS